MRPWWRLLAGLVLPTRCLLCLRIGPDLLCGLCRGQLEPIGGRFCLRCGRQRMTPWSSPDCGECHGQRLGVAKARSALVYNQAGRSLLAEFKYKRKLAAGDVLAECSLQGWPASLDEMFGTAIGSQALVVPVPMHRRRFRERRFNQAEFLARRYASHFGLGAPQQALLRTRETPTQVGLSANQRRENVRNAFEVPAALQRFVEGKPVILVDDLMTTGATLAACAGALRKAGAAASYGLTVFSTVPHYEQNLATPGAV